MVAPTLRQRNSIRSRLVSGNLELDGTSKRHKRSKNAIVSFGQRSTIAS